MLYPTLGITDLIFDGYINFRVCMWFNEKQSFAPCDNCYYPMAQKIVQSRTRSSDIALLRSLKQCSANIELTTQLVHDTRNYSVRCPKGVLK